MEGLSEETLGFGLVLGDSGEGVVQYGGISLWVEY